MTAICLTSCSIVYWSLEKDLEINHTSPTKTPGKKPYTITLWYPAKGTGSYSCYQNPLAIPVVWVSPRLWRQKIDRKPWMASQNDTHRATTMDYWCSHCARLYTSRLGLQSHFYVQRWTAQKHVFSKSEELPYIRVLPGIFSENSWHWYSPMTLKSSPQPLFI